MGARNKATGIILVAFSIATFCNGSNEEFKQAKRTSRKNRRTKTVYGHETQDYFTETTCNFNIRSITKFLNCTPKWNSYRIRRHKQKRFGCLNKKIIDKKRKIRKVKRKKLAKIKRKNNYD